MLTKNLFLLSLVVFLFFTLQSTISAYKHFQLTGFDKKQKQIQDSNYQKWFTQILDHSNANDDRTWQQRYFMNNEFANGKRNLAFLEIGGESAALSYWMTKGGWMTYAKVFKPILFQLEHRYYGQSHPTQNMSLENLVYLNSEQALGDIAFFIEAMNTKYNLSSNVKWIVFGASYAGNLAAWVRQKYPHLVHGAVSSSGPLLAKLDFSGYFNSVTESLRAVNKECPNVIKQSMDHLELLLRSKEGRIEINNLFKLCDSIEDGVDNHLDISYLFWLIALPFASVVQTDPGSRNELCKLVMDTTIGAPVTRLATCSNLFMKSYGETCLNYKYDNNMANKFKNISWESQWGGRPWIYQTCTEFGYYQTSSHSPHIFGNRFNLSFFIQQCIDLFGPKYNQSFLEKAVKRSNIIYGGLDIEVSNTVFVHGSIDPWRSLGVTKTFSKDAASIIIKGTSHGADHEDPSDEDTFQLKAARKKIQALIRKWITY